MNKSVELFIKEEIKSKIAKLPEGWQMRFKRMYSHKDLEADINDVIDNMPTDKLEWALTQVENSITKIEKQCHTETNQSKKNTTQSMKS